MTMKTKKNIIMWCKSINKLMKNARECKNTHGIYQNIKPSIHPALNMKIRILKGAERCIVRNWYKENNLSDYKLLNDYLTILKYEESYNTLKEMFSCPYRRFM